MSASIKKDHKIIVEEFFNFEEENNLFAKKIKNVRFWEFIRFDIYEQILIQHNILDKRPNGSIKFSTKLRFLINGVFNLRKNPYLVKQKKVVIISNARRNLLNDGYWWNIHFDPIIDIFNDDYMLFEFPFMFSHNNNIKTSNIRFIDFVIIVSNFKKIFLKRRMNFSDPESEFLSDIELQLHLKFGIKINLKFIILNFLLKRESILNLYSKLIRRINPKIVILTVSYGKEILIEVLKKLNIPIVELQHGVISKYVLAYSFPSNSMIKLNFPDYFFSFSNIWTQGIYMPLLKENIKDVGFPYFDLQFNNNRQKGRKKQILILSQWTIGSKMIDLLFKIKDNLRDGYTIVYKLHPYEFSNWRNLYPELVKSNVQIIESNQPDIYQLFAESEILIGVYSTAVIEGLAFGLKTFIYELPGVEHLEIFFEKNLFTRFKTGDELLTFLNQKNDHVVKDINDVRELIFRSESKLNMQQEIKKILAVHDSD
ncbi:MAG: CDP-glycerol glycerophosphotransferase family protein [Candidatus Heimdallarchaeota archaeon]|nr:CDP-glycerol glycerophosphotransferase family protein [Candidatus Heimdallarchaeota archaeon]MDH5647288.1 CDP-glycerol glycerophosphotransferase family protein [Candidatus Heimdallarchaeota archaeon]